MAALYRYPPSPDTNHGDKQENGGNSTRKGSFDMAVDYESRTIRRAGYTDVVSLQRRAILWHVFRALFVAEGQKVNLDSIRNGYDGEWNSNARNQVYLELRGLLLPLGITVVDRQLRPLEEPAAARGR